MARDFTVGKVFSYGGRYFKKLSDGSVQVVRRLFGHNEYIVKDAAKVAAEKAKLLEYYNKHSKNPSIQWVDNQLSAAQIDTVDGTIRLCKEVQEKYAHLSDGYLMEELEHFQQLHSRGWLGRQLTAEEERLLEDEVVGRLLDKGLQIFEPR